MQVFIFMNTSQVSFIGVWFYKNKVIQDILSDFQETLNYCDPISIDFCRNRNIVIRAFQSILRLFAPLL